MQLQKEISRNDYRNYQSAIVDLRLGSKKWRQSNYSSNLYG
jgi:hypothetical protein